MRGGAIVSGRIRDAISASGPENRAQRAVLGAIGGHADETGFAWPSVPTLAEECKYSQRHVIRCLAALERDGWLVINPKAIGHKGNSYQIVLKKLRFPSRKSGDIVSPEMSPENGKSQVTSATCQVTSATVSRDICDSPIRKEQSLEPSLEPSVNGGEDVVAVDEEPKMGEVCLEVGCEVNVIGIIYGVDASVEYLTTMGHALRAVPIDPDGVDSGVSWWEKGLRAILAEYRAAHPLEESDAQRTTEDNSDRDS
jgi:hypothetical protein